MKATFEVDLSDKAQVDALITFLQGSGATAAPAKKTTATSTTKTSAPAAPTKSAITLEHLKEITAKAVKEGGHRDAVKEKMDEYGAANISSIPVEKYEEYKEFIDDLNSNK
jgi:hypothetical protein